MISVSNSKRTSDRLLKGACLCLLLLFFMTTPWVQGKPADHLQVRRIANLNFGTWTGVGSLGQETPSCISSADDDAVNPPPSANQMPYQVRVDDNLAAAPDFYLYLNGNPASPANQRIRVSVLHRDQLDGNVAEQLSIGNWDTHAHVGGFRNCRAGDNSVIRVEISAAEMGGKMAGIYTGDFTLTATGGSSGTATDSGSFQASVTLQASPEVQISSLNDLSLGSHAGLGSIYAEENFCVYSSSASGSYSISISSPNQDGAGNFFLAGGLGQIPYDLFFIDQGNGPGSVRVTNTSLSGFGNSADQFCNGVNNATLSVSVQEQDLQAAKSGTYQDSLVILVAPQ